MTFSLSPLEDPRFADNPLVTNEPFIRFYAGCPLNVNGHKLGTLCIVDRVPRRFGREDIEALKDLASMVEHELVAVQMAILDELTKIPNRRGFLALAQNSLNLCARQKISAALAFLDLDKFKPINDNFGHAEGDFALTTFVNLMQKSIRVSDLFARLGGDEFVALFADTNLQQAESIVEEFKNSLKNYNEGANRGYNIDFSYGIVAFNSDKHPSIAAMLEEGDDLMYKVKQNKKKPSNNLI